MKTREEILANDLTNHVVTKRFESDTAYLTVLSDIHQGLNDRKQLQQLVEFLSSIDNMAVIIGGDSTNNNCRMSKGSVLEEWCSGLDQTKTLAKDLSPLMGQGKIIAITSGNHPKRVYNETFIKPEMMLACFLGDEDLYKGPMCFAYINVYKNSYVHHIQHTGSVRKHFYDFYGADFSWQEHRHVPTFVEKVIVEHNMYNKKPIVKKCFDIMNGSLQLMPEYAMEAGYRPYLPGYFIAEMGGNEQVGGMPTRVAKVWRDQDLQDAIKCGYKKGVSNG